MSLNKTLDRLFDEIRREAKRNPDFADRLDGVLRLHTSSRDVPDEVIEEIALEGAAPAGGEAEPSRAPAGPTRAVQAPDINPAGLYKRAGAEALAEALRAFDLTSLRALVAEHNLDPSGEAEALDRDALAAHVVAQAKRRAERDEKMFDY